ncbi:hemerythrin domain-containing protein [Hydrogenophaga sp.]|uniref:bacteriohemerythrin n=1 Tax=Hydrogenophaga sp. TaxID=1904254 RepID=UPI002624BFA8|nr:hemerythrin domain-containing protein [Hydrogenophaga sp.]MCW5653470.1 hemerythrin domain-containing protein [Hydrogenophaga sp.]
MMSTAKWSPALLLGYAPMDDEHRAFAVLLARAQDASDQDLPQAWANMVAHTEQHFGSEDDGMLSTGYPSSSQHMLEHRVVLNLMREGLEQAGQGQLAPVRQMARELWSWFLRHTQSQDAALALHLRRTRHGEPTTTM